MGGINGKKIKRKWTDFKKYFYCPLYIARRKKLKKIKAKINE